MPRASDVDWEGAKQGALAALETRLRLDQGSGTGLRGYQREVVTHVISKLGSQPGIIVAERTGQGKSQIAMAMIGSLACTLEDRPFRVGLLAPNKQVLENWVGEGKLLDAAFGSSESSTYLWRAARVRLTVWSRGTKRVEIDGDGPGIELFADHYTRGITNGYGSWINSKVERSARGREFLAGQKLAPLDLLIIDEGHQLRSSWNSRTQAIEALFGSPGAPLPVGRVLMLTATPFQLRAAPELARLSRLLRYPSVHGGIDFGAETAAALSATALHQLFDRYRRAFTHWLRQLAAGLPSDDALARARSESERVGEVLREVIVRTDAPRADLHVRYGKPDPDAASDKPTAEAGLELEDPLERLLFLAWDGSIASRTTFVATEQQTLSSSVSALGGRDFSGIGRSAAEKSRRPLAPLSVQTALTRLAEALSKSVGGDEHCKVRATVAAVAGRLRDDPDGLPVLVFAERSRTLEKIRESLLEALGDSATVEVLDGGRSSEHREAVVEGFRAAEGFPRVHALLASKVAEMGLDIDGPSQKHNIWLIHHDFPWNPAMVDQRNGRVTRPAKGGPSAPVFIMYPFIRDSVDERIFKRMLARQAFAEILLGTDDAVRALGLAVHENLDGLQLEALDPTVIRSLTPDLRPGVAVAGPAVSRSTSSAIKADQSGTVDRPDWCPVEVMELVDERGYDEPSPDFLRMLSAFREGQACPYDKKGNASVLRVDLDGRSQVVLVGCRRDVVEAISLADAEFSLELVLDVLRANVEPGVAGLVVESDGTGSERLLARATNPVKTLGDTELRNLILDTAARADAWELQRYGRADRW